MKWQIKENIEIETNGLKGNIRVSTVDILSFYDDSEYETMIFTEDDSKIDLSDNFQKRYETKEQAIASHKIIVKQIKKGKYKLIPINYRIEIEGEEDC